MNKVDKKVQLFFSSTPLWQGVYTWSTDMESTQQDFFWPFLSHVLANNIVTAQMPSNFFNLSLKLRSKQNEFPKLLPRQLKVCQWSTAVQRSPSLGMYNCVAVCVWLCGRIKHASMPLAHALFTLPWTIKGSTTRWQTKKRWNCWKTEQEGREFKVLSVGLKWRKCHYFLSSTAVESKCLPLLI